jgi:signal transduction histidine kinase
MVTMLNDVTKQKEIEKLKADFLANVSHELRTPLVAIEKSISLLLEKSAGEISQTQNQFLGIAERNLKRLTLLINDLLDLTKLEAKKMELQRSPASIEKVISESLESMEVWAKTKSLVLESKLQPGLPQVNIDSNRMTQVVINLLNNAIKFTPAGGKISVEAGFDQKEIRVSVADTGIGIEEKDLKKVFDKFFQTKADAPDDIAGTGIGLAIVKEIVELHGGRVWAESRQGEGAKFIFTIPAL